MGQVALSANLWTIPNWGNGQYTGGQGCYSEGPKQVGKKWPEGNIMSVNEGKSKSCVWDGIIPYNRTGLELTG